MYDVDATELIEELAKELKKIESVKPPQWAIFVKTGVNKERPPVRENWWYVRAASILRKISMKGPIGVSKLRTLYGGKQSRGYASEKYKKGSGSIIRKIIQQLQKAELVKETQKGVHKGRIITPKGIKLMGNVSKKIAGNKPVKETVKEEKPEPKKEEHKEVKKEEKAAEHKEVKKEEKAAEHKEAKKPEPKKEEHKEVKKEENAAEHKEVKKEEKAAEHKE
ncbi:MAG: 30S ribosomal protein S19e, partial [Nanoarchaeota archaeon]|nr:30S ribosomal protein S19e [Nanoarchaeota archaeon]